MGWQPEVINQSAVMVTLWPDACISAKDKAEQKHICMFVQLRLYIPLSKTLFHVLKMMDFKAQYHLEDHIVILRPLQADDVENLLRYSENEPELWKYSLIGANGRENLLKYIQTTLSARTEEKEYPFIVFDKRTNTYAGSTRFYDIQPKNETLQLGFTWYGKAFQGTGLNKHCKYLLLQFAFETLNYKRVEFRAHAENERSINAMKSIGCTVEGILRSNAVDLNGNRRSSIVLSILQEEWFQTVKSNLGNKLITK